ncbi:chondroitin AC lyase [Algoriphagus iocasae]|uniref:Chondroitin AC lyase n=1 Tax=Algoriphagus iocasae TaxID=1836499 RepID=A0A841MFQ3_9BACT|nr:polysaccharide lyase family 8 super-sandwich domain-containing protein [Algoriphagus iocasae]MBB6326170.1 chondroitin AC lyase [Algoriphagus iocasae]
MRFNKQIFCITFIFFFTGTIVLAKQESDFDIIKNRIFKEYQKKVKDEDLGKEMGVILKSFKEDGSWEGINYQDKSMSGWNPDKHIKRLGIMAIAYTRSGNKYEGSEVLYSKILQAMRYWTNLRPEPISDNWWWLSISVPKEIGSLLIAMRYGDQQVPQELEQEMLKWMNKTVSITKSPGKDGSNLTDIAQHMIMQSVLTENSELLNRAVSVVSESIQITKGDGIQRDMSFHAHGPELYMHGYGREYLLGIRNVAVYIVGTSFSFSPEQIALISDFSRNGYLKSMRGRYIDYSVIGRGIARNNATRTNSGLVKQLKQIDIEENQEEYQNAIDRIDGKEPPSYKIQPRNIHFWRSDYTIHQRPEFMVSVNIASSRTIRTESGNGENLTGQFLTEGAMYLAVKGDEYFNIFPNWEWTKIPGTTTPDNESLKKRTNWVAEKGNADFVGGVSDKLNGVSVYNMNAYNTKAKKAWFFFGDKIICIGSEISADREEKIFTTVNQSRLRGDVTVISNGELNTLNSKFTKIDNGDVWVYHDNIGYYFPESLPIELSAQNQIGSWSEINSNSSKKEINLDVFKLSINHGKRPKKGNYNYLIWPGVDSPDEIKNYDVSQIDVLRNDGKIQAVVDNKLNLLGLVFYEKGAFEWGENSIEVNSPCLLMLQEYSEGKWKINLSEPTQLLTGSIKVNLKVGNKSKNINFSLPKDDLAGSTITELIEIQ